jgi:hypothetical protein
MKKNIHTHIKWTLVFCALLISIGFFILPYITNGAGFDTSTYRPFGGRITSTTMGNVTCPGTGPITIQPVGKSISGPHWAMPGKGGSISSGAWVLGLHSVSMDTSCQEVDGPITRPYPAYKWFIYGTSR